MKDSVILNQKVFEYEIEKGQVHSEGYDLESERISYKLCGQISKEGAFLLAMKRILGEDIKDINVIKACSKRFASCLETLGKSLKEEREDLPKSIILYLALNASDRDVLHSIAERKGDVDGEILEILSSSGDKSLLLKIVQNPHVAIPTLEFLANDPYRELRGKIIVAVSNLGEGVQDLRHKLIVDAKTEDIDSFYLAANGPLRDDTIEEIFNQNKILTLMGLANNEFISQLVLKRLRQSPFQGVQKVLEASNRLNEVTENESTL